MDDVARFGQALQHYRHVARLTQAEGAGGRLINGGSETQLSMKLLRWRLGFLI